MLFVHWMRRAASRAACTAGNNRAITTAMIAITTRSSMSVKPRRVTDFGMKRQLSYDVLSTSSLDSTFTLLWLP